MRGLRCMCIFIYVPRFLHGLHRHCMLQGVDVMGPVPSNRPKPNKQVSGMKQRQLCALDAMH